MPRKATKGQVRDRRNIQSKIFTIPVIVKTNPQKWYISFTHLVPLELRKFKDLFPYSTKRFKIYKGINDSSLSPDERDRLAENIRQTMEYALKAKIYNPFQDELDKLAEVPKILQQKEHFDNLTKTISEEERRKGVLFHDALDLFIESRKGRSLEYKTLSAYSSTVKWLKGGISNIKLSDVKYIHVSKAIDKIAKENSWKPGTINHNWEYAFTVFKWLTTEDYILKNPLEGKIEKIKVNTTIHKWFDRETFAKVKEYLENDKDYPWLLRVCQFTYWIMIRSKKELQSIKVGDIDFDLHQIKFRKEWTKNDSDQNRDYPPEFQKVLDEMGLKDLPKNWYIFGAGGYPGPKPCGHSIFLRAWLKLRDKLKLSGDYTIYGMKHTRIVHMMMLGMSSYEISHAARHSNSKTTDEYKKDYDISLTKVYKKEDLTF